MKASDKRTRALLSFGVASLLAVGAATAQVASIDTGIDDSGSYQHEVQSCMSGKTQQDRATCLREARNAQADKQRGVLDNSGNLQANAMQRCTLHPAGEERAACEARVMGMGNMEGSVAGGGVLHEVETVVLPNGDKNVRIDAQTDNPVVLMPSGPQH